MARSLCWKGWDGHPLPHIRVNCHPSGGSTLDACYAHSIVLISSPCLRLEFQLMGHAAASPLNPLRRYDIKNNFKPTRWYIITRVLQSFKALMIGKQPHPCSVSTPCFDPADEDISTYKPMYARAPLRFCSIQGGNGSKRHDLDSSPKS